MIAAVPSQAIQILKSHVRLAAKRGAFAYRVQEDGFLGSLALLVLTCPRVSRFDSHLPLRTHCLEHLPAIRCPRSSRATPHHRRIPESGPWELFYCWLHIPSGLQSASTCRRAGLAHQGNANESSRSSNLYLRDASWRSWG